MFPGDIHFLPDPSCLGQIKRFIKRPPRGVEVRVGGPQVESCPSLDISVEVLCVGECLFGSWGSGMILALAHSEAFLVLFSLKSRGAANCGI